MRKVTIILSLLLAGCMDTNMRDPMLEARTQLNAQAAEAIALANSGTCVERGSCRKMGFGAKPCGGPWGYLVYSNSIDTVKLASLVQAYNTAESRYNREWGVTSDCTTAKPPDSLACASGKCLGYFNGVPRPN